MKKITSLKVAVLNTAEIEFGNSKYTLVVDMNALAKASATLNKDLTDRKSWQNMSSEELVTAAWAALDHYHPDVELKTVRQWFGAIQGEQYSALWTLLLEATFPGIVEEIDARLKEKELEEKSGKTEPNAPTQSL